MTTQQATVLPVDLGDRSYDIHIGPNLIRQKTLFAQAIRGQQVVIVTNDDVGPRYLDTLKATLEDFDVRAIELKDGEAYKNTAAIEDIYQFMLTHNYGRDATVIALGGGVVGDIAGFAAATYQRGVDFIQVPTTLLAQVDSSVGGKTGVNHALGKNMIGAFHQPRCVIADTNVLNTLPDRELSAGLAEVIKYGLIRDAEFFAWLENNIERLLNREPEALIYAIQRSCQNKAEIVAEDELESGVRALLNLGHTYGHAIETEMGYGNWLHGEAVAAGMVMAAETSRRLGWIDDAAVERMQQLLTTAKLPIKPPKQLTQEKTKALMRRDKKALAGQIRLILLKAIGQAVITTDYGPHLDATLEHFLAA